MHRWVGEWVSVRVRETHVDINTACVSMHRHSTSARTLPGPKPRVPSALASQALITVPAVVVVVVVVVGVSERGVSVSGRDGDGE